MMKETLAAPWHVTDERSLASMDIFVLSQEELLRKFLHTDIALIFHDL